MEDKETNSFISNSSEIFNLQNAFTHINSKSNNSSFYEEYSAEIEKINKKYFICKECKSIPKIIFNQDNSFNLKCNCKKRTNLIFNSNDFKYNYSYIGNNDKSEDTYLNNLLCKDHNSKKYKYYCSDCKVDICEECFIERHKRHSLIFFTDNKMELLLNDLSKLKIKLNSNLMTEFINWRDIKDLIEILMNEFDETPCIKLYKSINSAKQYLENLNKENNFSEIITDIKQFKSGKSFIFPIIEIDIYKQNFSDLSILKRLDLKNLKKLKLN